jgi:hypothetical protein
MEDKTPHFIVLVRFPEPVGRPVIHIAEALMTILFAAWNNRIFWELRPASLLRPNEDWGLNNGLCSRELHGQASFAEFHK